jgi:homoserine O-acetyltransferase
MTSHQPQTLKVADEILLQGHGIIGPVTLVYETYGTLNENRSNAILLCHALSGDAHVAAHPDAESQPPGWWDAAVGPGKAFDTNRYFVICSNVLGGCAGSTGPSSINPATGEPYGLTFPVITMGDMVEVQSRLLDALGIQDLLAVVGGSMGGMQALQWTVSFPARVRCALILASASRSTAQTIALNEVARQAIYADPNWKRGDYYGGPAPLAGLAVARMLGHISYLSDQSMRSKFGRRLRDRQAYGFDFVPEFQVETYLKHHGLRFTERFDANSLLYLTKAIDYFDLSFGLPNLSDAFRAVTSRFLVISFSSDWLYGPPQSEELVRAMLKNGIDATYIEIQSDSGHDAFLIEVDRLADLTRNFLAQVELDRSFFTNGSCAVVRNRRRLGLIHGEGI